MQWNILTSFFCDINKKSISSHHFCWQKSGCKHFHKIALWWRCQQGKAIVMACHFANSSPIWPSRLVRLNCYFFSLFKCINVKNKRDCKYENTNHFGYGHNPQCFFQTNMAIFHYYPSNHDKPTCPLHN